MNAITQPGRAEFIAMVATMMSLVALSVDIMLPAFGQMSEHFALARDNDRQLMITFLFVGLMVGQLCFGPLSDFIGRKPAILIGVGLHMTGSLICVLAPDFTWLLIGRLLQGFGGAGPRIVITAMVRDRFSGQAMGQIMSVALTVFILVPVFAPVIGQIILLVAPWQALFMTLTILACFAGAWVGLRQPETHTNREPFKPSKLWNAARVVFTTPVSILYALAAGCAFGILMSYIISAQQILQDLYDTGTAFVLYFGLSTGFIALAAVVNAWLLNRFSMELVTSVAVAIQVVWALIFLALHTIMGGMLPLWLWTLFISVTLFLIGMTFGNYNAIALRPLGAIAGIGSALVATIQTFFSIGLATYVGSLFDMSVLPVIIAAAIFGVLASLLMLLARRLSKSQASGPVGVTGT
ncbi:MAG: multidrug effflux MFS transporter [Hyphomicrobiales bacterium]